ncbi:MAG: class I SAM-dependent methyltransferase family protein [Patescibacteria group bacterium]
MEKHNPVLRFFSLPLIILLNILPAKISTAIFLAFSGKNGDTFKVLNGVTTFRALEVMYTYFDRRKIEKLNLSSRFWEIFLSNSRSIRNRLLLVKKTIIKLAEEKEKVNLLSIGSGSARPILETIRVIDSRKSPKIMMIDMDEEAISYSKELALKFSFNHTTWVSGHFFRVEKHCKKFKPNLIEMVGLLDYLNDKNVLFLLKEVFSTIENEGYLITGNILPNIEAPFVTKGIRWPMIYRKPEQLISLLKDAGFTNVKTEKELLGIHMIATAQKLV